MKQILDTSATYLMLYQAIECLPKCGTKLKCNFHSFSEWKLHFADAESKMKCILSYPWQLEN